MIAVQKFFRLSLFLSPALAIAGCTSADQVVIAPESPSNATPQVQKEPVPVVAAQRVEDEQLAVLPQLPPQPDQTKAEPVFEFAGEFTQGGWMRGIAPVGTVSLKLGEQDIQFDPVTREFFAAFDRDNGPTGDLKAVLDNGRTVTESVKISPRAWDIERVNVAKGTGGSSEAWWAKREPEWLAIKAAREKQTGAEGWKQDFVWPVEGRISGRFGRQRIYRGEPGSYHSGIDLAPGEGTPYVAPADGVVVLARQNFSLEGNLLIIDHGAGLNSAFLHSSKIAVEEGDIVKQGQYIGNVGATGRATGPHLHWSLTWNGLRLDPLLFTGPMR